MPRHTETRKYSGKTRHVHEKTLNKLEPKLRKNIRETINASLLDNVLTRGRTYYP